jgi:electron transfer flavoprotein beta subunit
MRCVVLVKPIRDAQATEGWSIGSIDHYALSHAIELRDASGGAVHVLVIGPGEAMPVARRALATGADEATFVTINDLDSIDALTIARLVRDRLDEIECDLILAGQTSDDIETGLVGAMVAEMLSLPQVSTVTRIDTHDGSLRVERDVVGGRQVIDVALPAVLLVLSGRTVTLRYPTPRGMIAARKKPVNELSAKVPAITSGIAWTAPRLPEHVGDGEILRDLPPQEAAARVAAWLRERGLTG